MVFIFSGIKVLIFFIFVMDFFNSDNKLLEVFAVKEYATEGLTGVAVVSVREVNFPVGPVLRGA